MVTHSVISLYKLQYSSPDDNKLIHDLSLTFDMNKIGIVGKNGVGKSTLLRLIYGDLIPSSGSISVSGTMSYCAQDVQKLLSQTVAQVFDIDQKLAALDRIALGSLDESDFECVGDQWTIKEDFARELSDFHLRHIALGRECGSLSGGELTRLFLAKTFFSQSDFLLFDEPTNNLDIDSKQDFYRAVQEWKKGLIIVSHDRELLNLMNVIVEMTMVGINVYGGSYDDYVAQRELKKQALDRGLSDSKKKLKQLSNVSQLSREKHDQRVSQGNNKRKKGSQPKILLDAMKDRSTSNQSRQTKKTTKMIQQFAAKIQEVKSHIEIHNEIKIDLSHTKLPNDKLVLNFDCVSFDYPETFGLINNFSLNIKGPARIALLGKNGSGKTTLVKLILGILQPKTGNIKIGIKRIGYLDQELSLLNSNVSILENFQKINPKINDTDGRRYLDHFLFRNQEVSKLVNQLSGGERIRAALCCVLCSLEPPELIILDEPTNHLDLEGITALESALNCYQGALIVISHDQTFLKNINISKIVMSPSSGE